MKAVILAAGKGTRMKELTNKIPKPMLAFQKENLLEHKFKNLPDEVDEVILVVGYLGKAIRDHFGHAWMNKKIKYVEQKELRGTGDALWQARELLDGKFLVLMGDDLYAKEDLEKLSELSEWGVLLWPEEGNSGGKCIIDEEDYLLDILENQSSFDNLTVLTYTGACVLTSDIFNFELAQLNGKNEFGLPQTFIQALPERKIKALIATWWKRITAPEDLE